MTVHVPNANRSVILDPYTATASVIGTSKGHVLATSKPAIYWHPLNAALTTVVEFLGAGADNGTYTANIWFGKDILSGSTGRITGFSAAFQCSLTATMCAGTYTADGLVIPPSGNSQTIRICDTLTVTAADATTSTPRGPMSASAAAFGENSVAAYSPADDATMAQLIIPHVGRIWQYVGFDVVVGAGKFAHLIVSTARP